jgi:hypothetical protein
MPGLATAAPRIALETDPELVMAAAVRTRDAYVRPENLSPVKIAGTEKRRSPRASVKIPVQIASVIMAEGDAHVFEAAEAEFGEVVDLSLHGLSLTHADLFMHYFCLVRFPLTATESVSLLVEVLWTVRETKEYYRSGGRFVGVIEEV